MSTIVGTDGDTTGEGGGSSSGGITELTGDGTAGPGIGSQAFTLTAAGVTPGSYDNPSITVDSKGRVTAAADGPGPSEVLIDYSVLPNGTTSYISPSWAADIYRALRIEFMVDVGSDMTFSYPGLTSPGYFSQNIANVSIFGDDTTQYLCSSGGSNTAWGTVKCTIEKSGQIRVYESHVGQYRTSDGTRTHWASIDGTLNKTGDITSIRFDFNGSTGTSWFRVYGIP